jgi:hypothetical protein
MFIGHFALGLAAKRATPRISLAVLFAAALLADLLWPVFLALGVERVRIDPGNTSFTPLDFVSYPYSHSLVTLILWGVVFGFIYRALTGKNDRAFIVLAGLVVSHWLLDFVTHRPDMPLYPGGPKLGLGLWNSVVATMVVELLMFGVGLWIYLRATRARDQVGRLAILGFALFLLSLYGANLMGGAPPSVAILSIAAIVGSLFLLLWSWWADRHRESIVPTRP